MALRNAFRVNADIGVFLKYSSTPKGRGKEYQFTFTAEHLAQLDVLASKVASVFVALVCVKDRQICCLSLGHLHELVTRRRNRMTRNERQYVLLVTIPQGRSFRAYVSAPRQKMKTLGELLIVARNEFPASLFQGHS